MRATARRGPGRGGEGSGADAGLGAPEDPAPRGLADAGDVAVDLELALAPVVVHEPDLPEHGALRPAHVVDAADAPHASDVPVRVVAVERVLVVEEQGDLQ